MGSWEGKFSITTLIKEEPIVVLYYFCHVGRFRFFADRLAHFFVAHSRHGTHSPFVYRLLDEVIYAKRLPGESADKVRRLTARLIERFQPGAVFTLADEPVPTSPLDFIIIDAGVLEAPVVKVEALWQQLHAGSVLLLLDIYRNAGSKALWHSIKSKPEVTVTIDLFCVGLVFFHSGQAKEDFKIRY